MHVADFKTLIAAFMQRINSKNGGKKLHKF